MAQNYDVAVVGAGVFGSWTAYHLQRLGLKAVLIDAYGAGNSRSSSGGESRIIRMGYGPNEIYTRWSARALGWWKELSARATQPLFHNTGVLWMAPPDNPYVTATVAALQNVGVRFERLGRNELEIQYPQINFDQITWAIYEPDSGALMARRAVQAVVAETVKNGADYLGAAVMPPRQWTAPAEGTGSGHLHELTTAGGEKISAGIFVFACGPWLPKLFPGLLGDRIQPTRQEVFFFGTPAGDSGFDVPRLPIWIDFGTVAYGFPNLENRGFKIALDRHGPPFDPDHDDRQPRAEMLNEVRFYLARRFPGMKNAPLIESRVCQYEDTSSGDFLIDRHPDFANVWLAGGGSGHGFKHGPALGEYLAERITRGGEIEQRFTLETKAPMREDSDQSEKRSL